MRSKTGSSSSSTSEVQEFQHSRFNPNKDDAISEGDLTQADGGSNTATQFSKSGVYSLYTVSTESDLTLFDSSQPPCSKARIEHDVADLESQRQLK